MANAEDIDTIREWLSKQPHLPEKVDDIIIERFLLACDGNIEKTKTVMDNFFRLRAECPEFFTDRDPRQPCVQASLKVIDTVTLPKRTPEGYQVYIHRLADPDGDKFDFLSYGKTFFILVDSRFRQETNIPDGDIPVFDMAGFSFKHLTRLMGSLGSVKKYMQITQETHPVRLKQIHIINTNALVKQVMNFMKPLMNSEVKKLIHFHSTMDSFYEFIPKDILPEEYGGAGGPIAAIREIHAKQVEDSRDWLMQNPWMSDEKKRPGSKKASKKSITDASSFNGSFKSICLD